MLEQLKAYKKSLAALVSFVAAVVTYQFADAAWASTVLGLLGVVGVYLAKNEPTP